MNDSSPSIPPLSSAYNSPESYKNLSPQLGTPSAYTPALDPSPESSVHAYPGRPQSLSPAGSGRSQSSHQSPLSEISRKTSRMESARGDTSVGSLAALDASMRKDRLEEIKERNNKILNRTSLRSTVRDRDIRSQPGTPEPTRNASSYRPDGSSPSGAVWSNSTIAASSSSSSLSPAFSSSTSPPYPLEPLPRTSSNVGETEQGESPMAFPARSHRLTRRSSFDSQPDEQNSDSDPESGSESESESEARRNLDTRVHHRAASAPYKSRRSPLDEPSQRTRPEGKGSPLGQSLSLPFVSDEAKRIGGRERREEILNRSRSRASLGYSSRAETPSFTSPRDSRSITADDLGSPFPPASSSSARRRTASSSFDLYSKRTPSPNRSPEEASASPAPRPPPPSAPNRLAGPLSSSTNGSSASNPSSKAGLNSHRFKSRVSMHEPRSASRLVDRSASSIGFHPRHPLSKSGETEIDPFSHDGLDRSSAQSRVASRTRDLLERIERENEASDRKRQALVENQAMKRAESSLSMFPTSNGFGFQRPGSSTPGSTPNLNGVGERIYPSTTGGIVRSSTSLSHFPERLSFSGTTSAADALRSRARSHRSVFNITSPNSATSNSPVTTTAQKRFTSSLSASVITNPRARSPLPRERRSSVLTGSSRFPPSSSAPFQTLTETQSEGKIQPEHVRNLLDALSHLEMFFARTKGPAGPSLKETARSASEFVKSATVLHQTIDQGYLANRELMIDAQVNYGSVQAQEQGQRDLSEGLVSLGMSWKEAGKIHDEQIRALTGLLIGLPRWMREAVGSRSDRDVYQEEREQNEDIPHLSSKPSNHLLSDSANNHGSSYKSSLKVPTVNSQSANLTLASLSFTPSSSSSESGKSTTSSLSSSLSRQLSSLTIESKTEVEAGPQSKSYSKTSLDPKPEIKDHQAHLKTPAKNSSSSLLTPPTPTPSSFQRLSPSPSHPSLSSSPTPIASPEPTEENSWEPFAKPYTPSICSSSGATTNSPRRSSLFPSAPKVSPAATTEATAIQAFNINRSLSGRTSVEDLSDLSDHSVNNYLPPLSGPTSTSGQTLRLSMPFMGRSNTLSRMPASSSVGLGAGASSASTSGGSVVGVSAGLSRRMSLEQSLNGQSAKLGLGNKNASKNELNGKPERPGPVSSAFRKLSFFGGN